MLRYLYKITGIVQGVGFRPFIYKLSRSLELTGFVFNDSNGVTIELQGELQKLELFEKNFYAQLPPLAIINTFTKKQIDVKDENSFEIIQTKQETNKTTLVSPDIKVCDDCLNDIIQKGKYHNYFMTNCTNCGPRYSIIKTVPYDRVNTSMSDFKMCKSCQDEYENPLNRRYHAQPISCNKCGPKLSLYHVKNKIDITSENIYSKITNLINDGSILAIKGIGGFHIVCDSTNDTVIEKLRLYKNRPTKPFAIMCKDINQIKNIANVDEKEKEIILSKEAPIVVLDKKGSETILSKKVAVGINKIGCFLPYTPLHHLLFEYLKKPIIATSANLGGEPIITTKEEIVKKLSFIDVIVDFNRDIVNAVDDSVVQIVDDKIQILRAGRGYTPTVLKLPNKIDKKILAVGANAKNSITLAFEDTMIISPYIGDLDSIVSFEYFKRTIKTFEQFYDFKPDIIVCDKHPNYETTKWAKQEVQKNPSIKLVQVQHHLAHIYATKAEYSLNKEYLGFSFDGTGYGDDGTLWGGEVFIDDTRKYYFEPIKLLGGVKAIKEPRRVALSMLFDRYSLDEIYNLELDTIKAFSKTEIQLLYNSYEKNLNAPLSSSVGRLFDGIASLAGLIQIQSYEGEAGLYCENSYNSNIKEYFDFIIDETGMIKIKYDLSYKKEKLVSVFMNTLVEIIVSLSLKEKKEVILTGGVFQNKTLLSLVTKRLKELDITYYFQSTTCTNDGGISLGQVFYTIKKM